MSIPTMPTGIFMTESLLAGCSKQLGGNICWCCCKLLFRHPPLLLMTEDEKNTGSFHQEETICGDRRAFEKLLGLV